MIDSLLDAVCQFITTLLIEFVFNCLFYWPGVAVLRVATIGRYPPPRHTPHNREAVALTGFIFITMLVVSMVMR